MESQEEVLARVRRRIKAAKARRSMSWEDVFQQCDEDRNGQLELKELVHALREKLAVPATTICDYEIRQLFKAMDADNSDGISLTELLKYLQQGPRLPEEDAARARLRVERVRKNIRTSFQQVGKNEHSIRKLFQKIDKNGDNRMSLYEFRSFVRHDLKLTYWDVNHEDLEDFFRYLDKDGHGVPVEELVGFVRGTSDKSKQQNFSFYERPDAPKLERRKTFKQELLENAYSKGSFVSGAGSASLPDLSRLQATPSIVSLGRSKAPTTRSSLEMAALMFFNPGKVGS